MEFITDDLLIAAIKTYDEFTFFSAQTLIEAVAGLDPKAYISQLYVMKDLQDPFLAFIHYVETRLYTEKFQLVITKVAPIHAVTACKSRTLLTAWRRKGPAELESPPIKTRLHLESV